ncbi:uncharacterized protein LOC142340851 [Convolutriloba macropyga]|uniref:uncharacterized protein LOC142340851 n=1 Tax=Convolutriloba macropyga TaxID=536237 RepID=UPI003F5244DB
MLLLLILFLSNHLVITLSADTVVSPEVNLDWTSQTFVIPPGPLPNDTVANCGIFSNYYCLHAYESELTRGAAVAAHHGTSLTDVRLLNMAGQDGDFEEAREEDLAIEYQYTDRLHDQELSQQIETLRTIA